MADDEVSVDTQGMSNASVGFQALVGHVTAAGASFSSKLAEIGNVWGDDATGKAFAANYQKPNETLREALPKLGSTLHGADQGMETSVKGYTGTNDENNASVHLGGDGDPGDSGRGSSGRSRK